MTQEGQALLSPTTPENSVEPIRTTTNDPPTEAHSQAEQDKPEAEAKDDIEEGKLQEEIRVEEGEALGDVEGRADITDEGGEVELKEERVDRTGDEDQPTDSVEEGEMEGTDVGGEGCRNVEVNSIGEEEAHAAEEMKEEEGRENELMQPCTEEEATSPRNAGRLVH